MLTETEVRGLINDVFEEEALLIGGLVAVHQMDDALVWRLVKHFAAIRNSVLQRIEGMCTGEEPEPSHQRLNLTPHPAIEDFLISLRGA